MTKGLILLFIISLVMFIVSLFFVVWQKRQTKELMKSINDMMDHAIDGTFQEQVFDESLLSALEHKLYRYLTATSYSTKVAQKEQQKITTLLADLSHQTKTPIANILLYAQLLEEQRLSENNQLYVQALNGQAQQLQFLIASLIKLSRLETGVFTLQPNVQPIAPMLEKLAQSFQTKAQQKQLDFSVEKTEVCAYFDRKWTAEALNNLVDNAFKYTQKGTVHIAVQTYELFCRIDISDTGIGIDKTEQAKIFHRFYRSSSVRQQDGIGIGLYLTRQILSEQGGYIKVHSIVGAGSTFSVFLLREG